MAIDWIQFFGGLHPVPPTLDRDASQRIERVLVDIEVGYATPLDLDALARSASWSRFHFLHRFQQATGDTPHHYLTRIRIARARQLLEETELPVTEVCLAVGFRSLGSFSSTFKRYTGRSPSAWRRRFWALGASPGGPGRGPFVPCCFLARFARVSPGPGRRAVVAPG